MCSGNTGRVAASAAGVGRQPECMDNCSVSCGFQRRGKARGLYKVGRMLPPSFLQCFGISLVYPPSQSPSCPQGHYRKFQPTSIYVSSSEASPASLRK